MTTFKKRLLIAAALLTPTAAFAATAATGCGCLFGCC